MTLFSPAMSCLYSSTRSAASSSLHAQVSRLATKAGSSSKVAVHLRATPRCQFGTTSSRLQRQVLGRIEPKRIVVRRPNSSGEGSGAGAFPKASIWRPTIFCVLFGGGGYIVAALYTNSDTAQWARRLGGGSWWRKGKEQPTDREIIRAKTLDGAKKAQQTVNNLAQTLSFLPKVMLVPILRIYVLAAEYRLNTPAAQVAPVGLIGLMGGVFLAWRVKRWEPFMRTWFLHRPVLFGASVGREWVNCVTLFTSTISHHSLAHYAFNSFALFSFGAAAYTHLSLPPPATSPASSSAPALPSSTHTPHFLAFLLLAGLTSSLSSHLWTNIVRLPRLIRTLSSPARLSSPQALAAHHAILPSLGASGAIYAALTLTACAYPQSNVGIIFIPFVSVPIGFGVAGMVAFDVLGLIKGWRMFDHVAHLSGAAFGFIYYGYGRQLWAWTRRQLGAREKDSGFQ